MNTIPISRDAVEQALLPCPFCGGLPKTTERPDNINGTEFFFAVACYCGGYSATAHKMAVRKTPEQAKRDAVDAWNTRAALAQADRPAVPQPCNHAFVKTTMVFDHETRVQEAACMHCGAKPEPQAQAGEPDQPIKYLLQEVSAQAAKDKSSALLAVAAIKAAKLLQSHREAIAKKDAEAAELRAALVGCVEALKEVRQTLEDYTVVYADAWRPGYDILEPRSDAAFLTVDAAITQAQEQLK